MTESEFDEMLAGRTDAGKVEILTAIVRSQLVKEGKVQKEPEDSQKAVIPDVTDEDTEEAEKAKAEYREPGEAEDGSELPSRAVIDSMGSTEVRVEGSSVAQEAPLVQDQIEAATAPEGTTAPFYDPTDGTQGSVEGLPVAAPVQPAVAEAAEKYAKEDGTEVKTEKPASRG